MNLEKQSIKNRPVKIAIVNQKGGVGKTTTALNLGAIKARAGYRVLIVDMDEQANASDSFEMPEKARTIMDYIIEPEKGMPVVEVSKNLFVLPERKTAQTTLQGFDAVAKQFGDTESLFVIAERFATELIGDYDFIYFDCPPALGLLTTNVLLAVDFVFVPLDAMKYAVDGMVEIKGAIDKAKKRLNPKLQFGGVFFTNVNDRTKLAQAYIEEVADKYADYYMKTRVKKNIALQEAPMLRQTITEYAPDSKAIDDYTKLAKEVIERINR